MMLVLFLVVCVVAVQATGVCENVERRACSELAADDCTKVGSCEVKSSGECGCKRGLLTYTKCYFQGYNCRSLSLCPTAATVDFPRGLCQLVGENEDDGDNNAQPTFGFTVKNSGCLAASPLAQGGAQQLGLCSRSSACSGLGSWLVQARSDQCDSGENCCIATARTDQFQAPLTGDSERITDFFVQRPGALHEGQKNYFMGEEVAFEVFFPEDKAEKRVAFELIDIVLERVVLKKIVTLKRVASQYYPDLGAYMLKDTITLVGNFRGDGVFEWRTNENVNSPCAASPGVKGTCNNNQQLWTFDGEQCVEFTYGGCGGTENSFRSMRECESACATDAAERPSLLPTQSSVFAIAAPPCFNSIRQEFSQQLQNNFGGMCVTSENACKDAANSQSFKWFPNKHCKSIQFSEYGCCVPESGSSSVGFKEDGKGVLQSSANILSASIATLLLAIMSTF